MRRDRFARACTSREYPGCRQARRFLRGIKRVHRFPGGAQRRNIARIPSKEWGTRRGNYHVLRPRSEPISTPCSKRSSSSNRSSPHPGSSPGQALCPPPRRDCVATRKNPVAVMLSAVKHLAFSVTYEDEILRLSPQDDIATQPRRGGNEGGGLNDWNFLNELNACLAKRPIAFDSEGRSMDNLG